MWYIFLIFEIPVCKRFWKFKNKNKKLFKNKNKKLFICTYLKKLKKIDFYFLRWSIISIRFFPSQCLQNGNFEDYVSLDFYLEIMNEVFLLRIPFGKIKLLLNLKHLTIDISKERPRAVTLGKIPFQFNIHVEKKTEIVSRKVGIILFISFKKVKRDCRIFLVVLL